MINPKSLVKIEAFISSLVQPNEEEWKAFRDILQEKKIKKKDMLLEEGLPQVFARHQRWALGVRTAVQAWGLPVQCADASVYSPVLTGVITPQGVDADAIRKLIHTRFDMSLGTGLGKLKGRMFRIGHLGDCNDLTLMAALSGCEMGLKLAGVKLAGSGVLAAMDYFASHPQQMPLQKAA